MMIDFALYAPELHAEARRILETDLLEGYVAEMTTMAAYQRGSS